MRISRSAGLQSPMPETGTASLNKGGLKQRLRGIDGNRKQRLGVRAADRNKGQGIAKAESIHSARKCSATSRLPRGSALPLCAVTCHHAPYCGTIVEGHKYWGQARRFLRDHAPVRGSPAAHVRICGGCAGVQGPTRRACVVGGPRGSIRMSHTSRVRRGWPPRVDPDGLPLLVLQRCAASRADMTPTRPSTRTSPRFCPTRISATRPMGTPLLSRSALA